MFLDHVSSRMEKETGLKKVRFDPYTKNKHSMGYTDF
jgi:hypothetical protein